MRLLAWERPTIPPVSWMQELILGYFTVDVIVPLFELPRIFPPCRLPQIPPVIDIYEELAIIFPWFSQQTIEPLL